MTRDQKKYNNHPTGVIFTGQPMGGFFMPPVESNPPNPDVDSVSVGAIPTGGDRRKANETSSERGQALNRCTADSGTAWRTMRDSRQRPANLFMGSLGRPEAQTYKGPCRAGQSCLPTLKLTAPAVQSVGASILMGVG